MDELKSEKKELVALITSEYMLDVILLLEDGAEELWQAGGK
jgi:hypothetical protein